MLYGLWQSESQVNSALEKLSSTSEKLKALKCQLDFRKKGLGASWSKGSLLYEQESKETHCR